MASILSQTTNEADARLIEVVGDPMEPGFKLIRGWPWIAGQAASGNTIEELIVTLQNTTSYTDPQANGKTYSGTFIHSKSRALDENERGVEDRACAIIQECTKVKATVTNVAGLGTPIIMADRETLNYLGFQEGEKFHFYYRYSFINPADRVTVMGLSPTAPTFTGFTFQLVKREWKIQEDQTATFYCVFEADTWPKSGSLTWAANKIQVLQDAIDGYHAHAEGHQLTGLDGTAYPTAYTAAKTPDTNRVLDRITLIERKDGEYEVQRQQRISFSATDTSDVVITEVQTNASGTALKEVHRTWFRRTLTAKNTLVTIGTGLAVTDFSYNSETYTFLNYRVVDHGDSTYDVIQTGVIPKVYVWASKHDVTAETCVKAYEVQVWDAVNGVWVEKVCCIFRKITSTAQLAADYADTGDVIILPDDAKIGVGVRSGSSVEYLGNSQWAGYKAVYRVVTGTPVWNVAP